VTANSSVLIGKEDGDRIVLRRSSATGRNGWFRTEVEVACDGWRGKFGADFMTGELSTLATNLEELYGTLQGEVSLNPIEPHLQLTFVGDGKGHIQVNGIGTIRFETGTRLHFYFALDQTFLPAIVKGLKEIDPRA
jgi:hypothetical protein